MTGPAVSPRPASPLRIFRDAAAAEAEGLHLNPGTGIVYRRYGANPAGIYQAVGRLRTDLETELAAALEEALAYIEQDTSGLDRGGRTDFEGYEPREKARAALAAYREAASE